ncbi:MAG: phosphoglucosamine mutase [Luteolibacter sp.]
MKLFGTDGIRGRVNEYPITAEIALRMGKAVAAILEKSGFRSQVVVGRDTRVSGGMLEAALTAGLVSMGVEVISVGVLPTPAVAFLTHSLGASGGIMLTASHNPYEDNGIKVFGPDGYKLSDDAEAKIERLILGEDPESAPVSPREVGRISTLPDGGERYAEFVKSSVGGLTFEGMKLVVDCGNGAAYQVGPRLFRDLGVEVLAMADQPDGVNINAGCGALHPQKAGELVRETNADLGVSFDGDADRVIFTDASGAEISGDRILALCALGLHRQGKLRNTTLVATVMSNLGLKEALANHGIRFEATAVGDRHVLECMRKNDFNFGGENSGHVIFSDYATTGDGILSALQVLRLMKESGKSLAELAAVMSEYPSKLVNLKIASKPPLANLPKLNALIDEAVKTFGDAGRQLIRYSGTENKIRILVEHRDAAEVENWIGKFTAVIGEEIGLS